MIALYDSHRYGFKSKNDNQDQSSPNVRGSGNRPSKMRGSTGPNAWNIPAFDPSIGRYDAQFRGHTEYDPTRTVPIIGQDLSPAIVGKFF